MKRKAIIATLISLVLIALATASATDSQTGSQLLVQTNWLGDHFKDSNVVVLHVAPSRSSYDAGHIPGARFLPLSDVAVVRNGLPGLPTVDALKTAFEGVGVGDKSRVIIYDEVRGLFAARVFFALDYLGRGQHAALLDGGLEKWKAEHRDVSMAASVFNSATLTVKARPELIVNLPAMKQIVADKKTTLIDSRSPDEYSGAKASDGVPRGGHIPGAKSVFWMDSLVSKDNPVLKPAAELLAMYEASGVTQGKNVVVYCRTGMQASQDYFTLKLLGFSPVLYEGSFVEWSKAPETPVETGKP